MSNVILDIQRVVILRVAKAQRQVIFQGILCKLWQENREWSSSGPQTSGGG